MRAAEEGVGGGGVGRDGESSSEAEGVSWIEGKSEEVGAFCLVADGCGEWDEVLKIMKDVFGRVRL